MGDKSKFNTSIFLKHKNGSLSNDFYLKIKLIVFVKCKTDE